MFTTPISKTGKLFDGKDQEGHYSKCLQSIVSGLTDDDVIENLGMTNTKDFGTHTIRKSIITYLMSLCDILTGAVVAKRCEWALGMHDTYLFL